MHLIDDELPLRVGNRLGRGDIHDGRVEFVCVLHDDVVHALRDEGRMLVGLGINVRVKLAPERNVAVRGGMHGVWREAWAHIVSENDFNVCLCRFDTAIRAASRP